jgi:hypothetical protein
LELKVRKPFFAQSIKYLLLQASFASNPLPSSSSEQAVWDALRLYTLPGQV